MVVGVLLQYYLTSGGCKFGSACKYNHSREKSAVFPALEFNFLGLPIRVVLKIYISEVNLCCKVVDLLDLLVIAFFKTGRKRMPILHA